MDRVPPTPRARQAPESRHLPLGHGDLLVGQQTIVALQHDTAEREASTSISKRSTCSATRVIGLPRFTPSTHTTPNSPRSGASHSAQRHRQIKQTTEKTPGGRKCSTWRWRSLSRAGAPRCSGCPSRVGKRARHRRGGARRDRHRGSVLSHLWPRRRRGEPVVTAFEPTPRPPSHDREVSELQFARGIAERP